ncbi:MAG: ester cyclase [Actinobacteria bacterium]|nr:MAG: ester cyclase [Actinomycetota bacterium]
MRGPLSTRHYRLALRRYGFDVAVSASQTSSAAELRGFVDRYLAAWNGCDADAMAQLVTEDVVWADPALPEPARGIAAVQEFMLTSVRAFPDLRFSEPDPPVLAVAGDLVLWGWRMEGTHRGVIDPPGFAPTGRGMRVEGVDQWIMRRGRISRYRAFYDMNEVARQLGIAPAPGGRAERAAVALQRLQARFASR